MKMIKDYMTVKEAAYRWGVKPRTLREKLNIDRRPNLEEEMRDGLVKYFKCPGSKNGDWILSRQVMEKWYGKQLIH